MSWTDFFLFSWFVSDNEKRRLEEENEQLRQELEDREERRQRELQDYMEHCDDHDPADE